ncbi:AraC family transcriptional regulator [Cellulosilyticum lentocellum]|uniref:Transcriptional regulator, AraC family n=1 Tax=Cellulosilyticum lentocellum (strain ATCC 49066 / DSM 5427 / NCIMB 11756 / RHM5) TaxID=642492 RepID=F2JGK0_CELLD|nr:AraC family transcriptional regulator [Cellulosilyticum lentocellum]ADZ82955.1 transcriptional regulator, AraC family [Cellulosilyticum lentocellum DSM 5427]
MVRKTVYAPHYDFFIDQSKKTDVYNMDFFHMHKKYEIYYLLEGSRKYFIDDSIYLVNAGSLVLIDADSVHKTANMGDVPHSRIVINFSSSFIEDFSDELKAMNLTSIFKTKFTVLPLSFKYKLIIENILFKLVEIGSDDIELGAKATAEDETLPNAYKKTLLKLQLSELLIMIKEYLEILQQKEYESHQIVNNKVDKIIKYISAHYTEDLTLTSIAEQFYISPFYLSKIFKKSTNLSIIEYINSLRIRNAKELLESSSTKIADIAELVGFSSSSHFSRTFKLVTGLSPQQYKKYYSTR